MRVLKGPAALAFIALCGLVATHCFSPSYSDCAFRCGSDEPRCPPDYECRPDNYCHRPDSTNICLFGVDLAGVTLDMGLRPDSQ